MSDLIGKWGSIHSYYVNSKNQEEYIHPYDLTYFGQYSYIRSLHKCISIEGNYVILEFGNLNVRVLKEVFYVSEQKLPEFKPLEKVKYLSSKGNLEYGKVIGIHWHNKDRRYYYYLEVNGKKKSRMYYSEDLQKIEE
ncbi:hypothetical protein GCM10022393_43560 [Aquimarina addita]|uniref:Uncharacterized protein n=1 Tax=Aquimarina addita TaxID=870485 RepID=A0ABP6UZM0_9FLAO